MHSLLGVGKIASRYCLGAPVCPCAPICTGKQKLPPFCNQTSKAGYRLVVTASGNLCVKDTASDTNRWCALKQPQAAAVISARGGGDDGRFYMMLADDGSICLHAGSYTATAPANTTLWCHVIDKGGKVPSKGLKQIPGAVRIRNTR